MFEFTDDSNPESQKLKSEIKSLGGSLKALKDSTKDSEQIIVNSIEVFEQHKTAANMMKPWLEKAHLQTSSIPKPITLQDTEHQLQQAKKFQIECKKQVSQLQGSLITLLSFYFSFKLKAFFFFYTLTIYFVVALPSIVKEIPLTAVEEVDNLKAKCETIQAKADHQVQLCEKTVKAFEDFEKLASNLENWVVEAEKKLNASVDFLDGKVPRLEEGLELLKVS